MNFFIKYYHKYHLSDTHCSGIVGTRHRSMLGHKVYDLNGQYNPSIHPSIRLRQMHRCKNETGDEAEAVAE